MVRARISHPTRPGVTLTELLVVVSVIVVLAGLTFTMFSYGKKTADRHDSTAKVAYARSGHNKFEKIKPGQGSGGKESVVPKGKVPDEWIITFQPGVGNPQAEAQRLAKAFGGKVKNLYRGALHGFALQSTTATVAKLKQDPAVKDAEQGQYFHHCGVNPSGVRRIQAVNNPSRLPYTLTFPPLAGVKGVGGGGGGRRNIKIGPPPAGSNYTPRAVAVLDTGVDKTHPDLNVTFSRGFAPANLDGSDGDGHGTHVAGTIGARTTGVTPGVFPGVPIWSIAVLGPNGGTTASVIAGIDEVYFWRNQISVANMSLGGGVSAALNNAVDNLAVNGVVVVVAAGNSSANAANYSPASANQVICVASMSDSDGLPGGRGPKTVNSKDPDDTFASYSNWGNVVDVIAPGSDILSTWPPNVPHPYTGKLGLRYASIDGTSMAAPHVAGMCAIISELGQMQAALGSKSRLYIPQPLPPLLSPEEVRGLLFTLSNEQIPGKFDNRSYPLISGRP